jgi:hypothetical protein
VNTISVSTDRSITQSRFKHSAALPGSEQLPCDLPWKKRTKAAELRSAGGLKGSVDRELAPLTAPAPSRGTVCARE